MKKYSLAYWGKISAILGHEQYSLFITQPDQHIPARLYRLDASSDHLLLNYRSLPCGMQAMCALPDAKASNAQVLLLGENGVFYQSDWQTITVTAIQSNALATHDLQDSSKQAASTSISETNTSKISSSQVGQNPVIAMQAVPTIESEKEAMADLFFLVLYAHSLQLWRYVKKGKKLGILKSTKEASVEFVQSVPLNTAALSASATAMSVSSDGRWVVVGDSQGHVSSYVLDHANTAAPMSISSSEPLHQSQVTALCFEPEGLHFFSTAADKMLLRTFAQGKLQGIDRGKASQHGDIINTLIVSENRLYSGSDDKSIKSWAFDKGQPASCKEDLVAVKHLVQIQYAKQDALIAVGPDQSLRFVLLDKEGKPQQVDQSVKDGYSLLSILLKGKEPVDFEDLKNILDHQADPQILEIVTKYLDSITDVQRSDYLVYWIASTNLSKTVKSLQDIIMQNKSESARKIAFDALAHRAQASNTNFSNTSTGNINYSHLSHTNLGYLKTALASPFEDMNRLAITGFYQVAQQSADSQNQVLPILQQSLSNHFVLVRRQALAALEQLLPSDSARADLLALDSPRYDLVQAAIIRLYQRKLTNQLEVKRQLMAMQHRADKDVHLSAFFASVFSSDKLTQALAARSSQFARVLQDFNTFQLLPDHQPLNNQKNNSQGGQANQESNENSNANNSNSIEKISLDVLDDGQGGDAENNTNTSKKSTKPDDKQAIKKENTPTLDLTPQDLEPLIQGIGAGFDAIVFRAAFALALLDDERAFGVLVRLANSKEADIRRGVANAFAILKLPDAISVLTSMLDDEQSDVRNAAMTSLGKLYTSPLQWSAAGFASAHQDIHQQALAILLTHADEHAKNSPPNTDQTNTATPDSQTTAVLRQAINNRFTSIRQEVVKVMLNRGIITDMAQAIDILQQSLFEDVHQTALEQWQAWLEKQPSIAQTAAKSTSTATTVTDATDQTDTAIALSLASFLADDFANIRASAYATALKMRKHITLTTLLKAAITSPHLDMREQALATIIKIPNAKTLALIESLFEDDNSALRLKAFNTAMRLLPDLQSHATAILNPETPPHTALVLERALDSCYPDIQLAAARTLAIQLPTQNTHSSEQAYQVFKHFLTQPMPTLAAEKQQWKTNISEALQGLADLGDPRGFAWFDTYLHHPDVDFSSLAPLIIWVSDYAHLDNLADGASWLHSENTDIKQAAATTLAIYGDNRGQSLIEQMTNMAKDNIPDTAYLRWHMIQNGYGITSARQLHPVLSASHNHLSQRLLPQLLLCFYDLIYHPQRPSLMIEALSFVKGEAALLFTNVIARFANQAIATQADLTSEDTTEDTLEISKEAQTAVHKIDLKPDNVWHFLAQHLNTILDRQADDIAVYWSNYYHEQSSDSLTQRTREEETWQLTASQLKTLAQYSVSSSPQIQARALELMYYWDDTDSHIPRYAQWQLMWQRLSQLAEHSHLQSADNIDNAVNKTQNTEAQAAEIQAAEIEKARQFIEQRWQRLSQSDSPSTARVNSPNSGIGSDSDIGKNKDSQTNHWHTLAYGAFVGILKDHAINTSRVSTQAVNSLYWLAQQDSQWIAPVQTTLLSALDYHNYPLLNHIWDTLTKLGIRNETLGTHAMNSPITEIAERGMSLWLKSLDNNSNNSNIANAELTRLIQDASSESFSQMAYRHLLARTDATTAAKVALQAYNVTLRRQVDEWQQVTSPELKQAKIQILILAAKNDDWTTSFKALKQLGALIWQEAKQSNKKKPTDSPHPQLNHRVSQSDTFDKAQSTLGEQQQAWLQIFLRQAQRLWQLAGETSGGGVYQRNIISLYQEYLPSDRGDVLLSLLDAELPYGSDFIYSALANMRNTAVVPPLLQRLKAQATAHAYMQSKEKNDLIKALLTISGYDQYIKDYDEVLADNSWLDTQYPRHPLVLIQLFKTLVALTDYRAASNLLESLSWASDADTHKDTEIDADIDTRVENPSMKEQTINQQIDDLLYDAYLRFPSSSYHMMIVRAMAYRAERRSGDTKGLHKALSDKDDIVQFLAAESLAKVGNSAGYSILMATIDYSSHMNSRERAVLALGEMGAEQAFDKLIGLAQDDTHLLQPFACEALGHLGKGEHAAYIFNLLDSRIKQNTNAYNPDLINWLNGLRWLNTAQAWQLIRQYIKEERQNLAAYSSVSHAISLLKYSNGKLTKGASTKDATKQDVLDQTSHAASESDLHANKELLLELLRTLPDYPIGLANNAYESAQHLWGTDDTTIYAYDWAILQNANFNYYEDSPIGESLKRVTNNATLPALTEFFILHQTKLQEDIKSQIVQSVLDRDDMPKEMLDTLIQTDGQHDLASLQLGLRYLTSHITHTAYWSQNTEAKLWQQFSAVQRYWQQTLLSVSRHPKLAHQSEWQQSVNSLAQTGQLLLWLLMRYGKDNQGMRSVLQWLLSFTVNHSDLSNSAMLQDEGKTPQLETEKTAIDSVPKLASTTQLWLKQVMLALLARLQTSYPEEQPSQQQTAQAGVTDPTIAPLIEQIAIIKNWSTPGLTTLANSLLLAANVSVATSEQQHSAKSVEKSDTSSEPNIQQQLQHWIQQGNAEQLYALAASTSAPERYRMQAIEGLGIISISTGSTNTTDSSSNINDNSTADAPNSESYLQHLLNELMKDADKDVQHTAYKVLRRRQRQQQKRQKQHMQPKPVSVNQSLAKTAQDER